MEGGRREREKRRRRKEGGKDGREGGGKKGRKRGGEGRGKEVSNCSHMKLFHRALLISIPPAFQPAEKYIDINCAGATAEFYCSSATKLVLEA